MTDYEALLEEAKTRIARLPNNTYFVLKDLFLGLRWEQIPRGERSYFGRYFKYAVERGEVQNVSVSGENKIHSTLYVKR